MKNNSLKNNIRILFIDNFLSILLITFFCSEAYGKTVAFSNETTILQSSIKLVVLIYLVIDVLINYKKKNYLITVTLLSLFFIIGQYIIPNSYSSESIILFSKYLFPLFLFLYFNCHTLNKKSVNYLFKVFELIIILNSLLVILGVLFDISIFETYQFARFGYNGLLRTSSTSTYFYIISLFYFLYTYREHFFSKWKSIFVFIVCLFVGTKSIYLGLGAIILAFLFLKIRAKKQRYILGILLILVFSVIGYLLFFEFGKFNQIRESNGIISSILSYRDQLFLNKTLPNISENWGPVNYLLGGFNDISSRSQLDFIDILHFWGIIGGIFYLITYYKLYVTFYINKIALFCIVFLIFIIFFAGNFFTYSTIPIYLLIIREVFLKSKTNANNEHSNK
ncbi:hypothetical protein ABXT64_05330 [Candidatus Marifrigoribacter sp. Uisw_064]|uniref:hypothetical protein n=1 Tax=Candidatus Marifrigoribacter sp. Uisw_064 TaxID=3230970 RepID=UPI003D59BD4D